MKRFMKLFILCFCFLFIIPYASAKADHRNDNKKIDPGSSNRYPNANALVLSEKITVQYEANGDYTQTIHRRVKILTEKGKKEYSTDSFSYHRRYGSIVIKDARVIKPDGTIKVVDASHITDSTLPEVQRMNIFEENFRRKTIFYPSLDLQDIIDTTVVNKTHGLLKNNYSDIFIFQYQNPILFKSVEIRGPKSLPLHFVVKNGKLQFSKKIEGEEVVYKWSAKNVPAIVPEPGMLNMMNIALRLIVSTFPDWPSLSRYGCSLNNGKIDSNEAMIEKVRELTDGLTDVHSKIMAIFRFVSSQVRYLGSSMDMGAFLEPHKATFTFEKKYGVCRDKSVLLIAMLKLIGIKADDTLINVSVLTDPEVPSIYFQHAICCVELPEGGEIYMDPTLELSTSYGEPYIGDRYVLKLTPKGSNLYKVPHSSPSRSLGTVTAESKILSDGSLDSMVEVKGKGFYDYLLRAVGKKMQGLQFAQLWQRLANMYHPGSQINNLQVSSPTDLSTPFVIKFQLKSSSFWFDVNRFRMFKVPLSTNYFELYTHGLPALTGLKERKYPMFLFSTIEVRQNETLEIPPHYKVLAVPDEVNFAQGPFKLVLKTTVAGNKIKFHEDYSCNASIINPHQYKFMRIMMEKWQKYQKAMVILEKEKGALK